MEKTDAAYLFSLEVLRANNSSQNQVHIESQCPHIQHCCGEKRAAALKLLDANEKRIVTDPSAIHRRRWWPCATQSSLDVSDNCVFYLSHFRDQHIRALSLQNPFLKLWIIFATEAVRYRRRPVLLALLHIGPFLANPKDSLRSIWSNLFRHHGAKTGMRYRYACFFFCLDAYMVQPQKNSETLLHGAHLCCGCAQRGIV